MLISRSTFGMAVVAALVAAGSAWAEDLTNRVASSLRDSGALAGYRVNVKAKDGTVWLTGTVTTPEQIAAAVGIVEATPGVERVVNRLTVARDEAGGAVAGVPDVLSLPESIRSLAGRATAGSAEEPVALATGVAAADGESTIQLVAAQRPAAGSAAKKASAKTKAGNRVAGVPAAKASAGRAKGSATPRPLGSTVARPIPMRGPGVRNTSRQAVRTSAESAPMMLPTPADYGHGEGLVDGQMVPGSMRISEGQAVDGPIVGGGGMGRPMPMGSTGVGMPPVPVRGDGPNMPNYAWPSYAAYPNYAALQYPTQYSPTAWPYIGPFYPYPQVPLGWRRVSLEWDDGWWFLDFDDRHHHSHHR